MKQRTAYFMLVLLVVADEAHACSGFYIAKDSIKVVCKNTDATEWKSNIWFTPATDTTFGYVCFGFEYPFLADGMNDKGLVISHYSGHEKQILKSIHKPIYNGVLSELVLATCSSVQDVKKLLQQYNLSLFHNGMIMYSDKYGNSMIVEGDTIIEKKHFYQICMNTYQSECDEDTHPFWNQVAAKKLIPGSNDFSYFFCRDVLQRMHDDMTQYSIIYDINRLTFFVYLFHDYEHGVGFDLLQQLKKGKQIAALSPFFPQESKYYQVYVDRQAPQNNMFILFALIICGLINLYTLLVWPFAHLLKKVDYKERNETLPKINKAKVYSFIVCILLSMYLIVLMNFQEAFQIGLPPHIDNFSIVMKFIIRIPLTVAVLLVPLVVVNYKNIKQNQSSYFKWQFTINTVSYVVLSGLFFYWGFIYI